jgi:hypothetical protein
MKMRDFELRKGLTIIIKRHEFIDKDKAQAIALDANLDLCITPKTIIKI